MNNRTLVSSALASVMAMGLVSTASAQMDMDSSTKGKEKCFGVVKAGQNSCANLSGTHSCAGQATKDNDSTEWKLVPKGSCAKMGGLNAEQAKAQLAKADTK